MVNTISKVKSLFKNFFTNTIESFMMLNGLEMYREYYFLKLEVTKKLTIQNSSNNEW